MTWFRSPAFTPSPNTKKNLKKMKATAAMVTAAVMPPITLVLVVIILLFYVVLFLFSPSDCLICFQSLHLIWLLESLSLLFYVVVSFSLFYLFPELALVFGSWSRLICYFTSSFKFQPVMVETYGSRA